VEKKLKYHLNHIWKNRCIVMTVFPIANSI
jgi:hypothetical protein